MMNHSVITPHSYHGYQGNTEDRVIPAKIGCAERDDRAERTLFQTRSELLQTKGSSWSQEQSSIDPTRNLTITRGLEPTTYSTSFHPPSTKLLNQSLESQSNSRTLPRHNSYEREDPPRQNSPANYRNLRSSYSSSFDLRCDDTGGDGERPMSEKRCASVGTLRDFNRRKWQLVEDFKPNRARKTSQEDIQKQSQSNKHVIAASAVGSVRDQRSDGRVKLTEGLADDTSYRLDFGRRGENPLDRVPRDVRSMTVNDLKQFATTFDLRYVTRT